MYKAFLAAGGFAALAIAAPAAAVTGVTQCQSGTLCAISFDGTAGTFRNSEVNASPFTDIYTFDIARSGLLNLTLSSSYPGNDLTQDIDFSRVRLTGPGGVDISLTDQGAEPLAFYFRNNIAVAAGQYTLDLAGTAGSRNGIDASYAGTLNFTGSVPEPMTWALMLMGFGMVGGALRNRRRIPVASF